MPIFFFFFFSLRYFDRMAIFFFFFFFFFFFLGGGGSFFVCLFVWKRLSEYVLLFFFSFFLTAKYLDFCYESSPLISFLLCLHFYFFILWWCRGLSSNDMASHATYDVKEMGRYFHPVQKIHVETFYSSFYLLMCRCG